MNTILWIILILIILYYFITLLILQESTIMHVIWNGINHRQFNEVDLKQIDDLLNITLELQDAIKYNVTGNNTLLRQLYLSINLNEVEASKERLFIILEPFN